MVDITARYGQGDDAAEATVEFDTGANLTEAVELFGDEVVFNRFRAGLIIDVQANIRRMLALDNPKSSDEIQEAISDWMPGVKSKGKSKAEKANEAISKLSTQERAALFAQYEKSVGA